MLYVSYYMLLCKIIISFGDNYLNYIKCKCFLLIYFMLEYTKRMLYKDVQR